MKSIVNEPANKLWKLIIILKNTSTSRYLKR